jgi:hypothetical protein
VINLSVTIATGIPNAGDIGTVLSAALSQNNIPYNLANVTAVTLNIVDPVGNLITRGGVITSPTSSGIVSYNLTSADLPIAGKYNIQAIVVFNDGEQYSSTIAAFRVSDLLTGNSGYTVGIPFIMPNDLLTATATATNEANASAVSAGSALASQVAAATSEANAESYKELAESSAEEAATLVASIPTVPFSITNGGTGSNTQQGAINSLTGAQSAGKFLRSDGTNSTLEAIQVSDIPTLNQNTTGTASNVTGIVGIANGGTGATTPSQALTNLGAVIQSQLYNFGMIRNFKAQVTSNTTETITADYNPFTQTSMSLTLNTANTGATGLDTGLLAASKWYYVHVIYGTAGISCLMSLSRTAPILPSGYSNFIWTGSVYCDTNKYLMRTSQAGRRVHYVVTTSTNTPNMPIMASGTTGSISVPTWTPIAVGNFIPPSASTIIISVVDNSGTTMVAPNNAYGSYNSVTNPPPIVAGISSTQISQIASLLLESTNIYWANNAPTIAIVACFGWEENL